MKIRIKVERVLCRRENKVGEWILFTFKPVKDAEKTIPEDLKGIEKAKGVFKESLMPTAILDCEYAIERSRDYGTSLNIKKYTVEQDEGKLILFNYLNRFDGATSKRLEKLLTLYPQKEIVNAITEDFPKLRKMLQEASPYINTTLKDCTFTEKEEGEIYKISCLFNKVFSNKVFYNMKLYYGDLEKAYTILKQNPYSITRLPRIGFKTADDTILKSKELKIDSTSKNRILAGIRYALLDDQQQNGNCYVEDCEMLDILFPLTFKVPNRKNALKTIENWEIEKDKIIKEVSKNMYNDFQNAVFQFELVKKALCEILIELSKNDLEEQEKVFMESRAKKTLSFSFNNDDEEDFGKYNSNFMGLVYVDGKIYLEEIYFAEKTLANNLRIINNAKVKSSDFDNSDFDGDDFDEEKLKEKLEKVCEEAKINLTSDQKKACLMPYKTGISILTGGPGTGKTTTLNCLSRLWKEMGGRTILAAPTGKAAKQMQKSTGHTAKTVDSLNISLSNPWVDVKVNSILEESAPILIVCDESSMLDVKKADKLLTELAKLIREKGKKIGVLFMGDIHQLPSIGPGAVLKDMLKCSNIFSITALKIGFRNVGTVKGNANMISEATENDQSISIKDFKLDSSFKIFPETKVSCLNNLVSDYLTLASEYGEEETMLLTAKRDCVNKANAVIQKYYAEERGYVIKKAIGGGNYTLKDRVMITKNISSKREVERSSLERDIKDCKKIKGVGTFLDLSEIPDESDSTIGVINGDIGSIVGYLTNGENKNIITDLYIQLDDGRVVKMSDSKEISLVQLAYAMTYHKSQGSQAKAVICDIKMADYYLANRALLFTGITRSSKLVHIHSERNETGRLAFEFSINKVLDDKRKTSLIDRINK